MKKCFECDNEVDIHQHHVIPRVLGGSKTIDLCAKCHGVIHGLDFSKHSLLIKEGLSKTDKRLGRPLGKGSKKDILQRHKDVVDFLKQKISIRKIAEITSKGGSTVQRVKKILDKEH
jgi:hypothetical protein